MSSSWQLISPTFKDRFQRAIQSQYIHIEENVKNHFFLTGAFPWVCLIIFKLNVITAYFSYLSLTKNGKTKGSRKHVFGFFFGPQLLQHDPRKTCLSTDQKKWKHTLTTLWLTGGLQPPFQQLVCQRSSNPACLHLLLLLLTFFLRLVFENKSYLPPGFLSERSD